MDCLLKSSRVSCSLATSRAKQTRSEAGIPRWSVRASTTLQQCKFTSHYLDNLRLKFN